MTEIEWLNGTYLGALVQHLRGKASDRKLRLFACACVRQVWHLLEDERSRQAVVSAEMFADGQITVEQLATARNAAQSAKDAVKASKWAVRDAANAAWVSCRVEGEVAAWAAAWNTRSSAARGTDQTVMDSVMKGHCDLFREVFGNPYHRVGIDPTWLTCGEGRVLHLAQTIYNARAFDRMPILADALEDAGCRDAAILGHCRDAGEHVRGCWVVDLLLGKE
jgi:hypothetical protein